ncbi:MAG: hypothetical protein NTX95_04955 [Actinobacteria bacterium]|nr:hypothetical protein [Actinomycetota bacterium]
MRKASLLLVLLAVVLGGGLVAGFVALGGTSNLESTQTATTDPCTTKIVPQQGDAMEAEASSILLTSLNTAACSLEVTREDLVLALGSGDGIDGAARLLGVQPAALQDAVLGAITETVDAESAAGRLTPTTALAIQTLIDVVPPDQLLAAVRNEGGECAPIAWKQVDGLEQITAEVGVLTGLRAACALQIAPIEAVAALADPAGLQGLAARSGRSQDEVEQAVRTAMVASIEQAQEAGALSGTEGSVLGAAAAVAPVERILAIVRGDDDPCEPFAWSKTTSSSQALAEVALLGVVDAACQLQAPTFDVFAALANPSELATLEQTTGKSEAEINAAIKDGLQKGLAAGQDAGDVSGLVAFGLNLALSQANVLDLLSTFVG